MLREKPSEFALSSSGGFFDQSVSFYSRQNAVATGFQGPTRFL